jgi:hypothetical protein
VLDSKVFKPGTVEYAKLEGNDWHIQWLENHWKSNTHRILPGGEDAQLSYLKARRLKARRENGFDYCWKPLAILWALMDRFATICILSAFLPCLGATFTRLPAAWRKVVWVSILVYETEALIALSPG